jgi:nitrite reductase/ring-hydroxylating ferredoxin subunit
MGTFHDVAPLSALPPGKSLEVTVQGQTVALFNVGGTIHALAGECTHAGGPLCEGEIENGTVVCPWHAAAFDLTTGKALTRPATLAVHCFRARVENGRIEVELE